FWRICRWCSSWNCLASGCRLRFMRCTVSTSGTGAMEIRSNIPGAETGCTRRSAGPAASLSPTSFGTPGRCVTGTDLHAYPNASFGKVQAELMNPALLAFYIVGLIAACWHFCYGIWLFAAKWGITSGEKARQRFLAICLTLFALMTLVGLVSLYTFRERFPQSTAEPGTSAMQSSPAAQPNNRASAYGKPVE